MRLITRAEWKARPAKDERTTTPASSRSAFMVHYSTGEELGREDCAAWVREVQRHHMDVNGWDDIGYNFLVCRHGDVFVGRGWDAVGAHCAGYNTPAWGVCFLGDDDPGQDVPTVARQAIRELRQAAVELAGHDLDSLGHRDKYPTACPGDELWGWVHAGLPVTTAAPAPAKAQPAPAKAKRDVRPPAFPLPRGWYFGPASGPRESVSGIYGPEAYRRALQRFQERMMDRGWKLPRFGADGRYGDELERVVRAFQDEKDLQVDGRIGPETWAAAWTEPVT